VRQWVESLVVGLNLCPFARPVLQRDLLRIEVIDTPHVSDCLRQVAEEAARLDAQEHDDATTLLVLPDGFNDFADYLDLLQLSTALLDNLGFSGRLQLASFHPAYQFEGTLINDVSNWTNRAPYPVLHLLQEAAVSRAVEQHGDIEGIPERNIKRLQKLGLDAVLALMSPARD